MEALRHQGKVANQNGSYWSITTAVCQRTAASNLQTNQDFKAAFTYLPLGVKTEGYQGSLLSIHQQATSQQRGILRFLWLFRHNIITSLEGLAKKKIPLKIRIFISALSTWHIMFSYSIVYKLSSWKEAHIFLENLFNTQIVIFIFWRQMQKEIFT